MLQCLFSSAWSRCKYVLLLYMEFYLNIANVDCLFSHNSLSRDIMFNLMLRLNTSHDMTLENNTRNQNITETKIKQEIDIENFQSDNWNITFNDKYRHFMTNNNTVLSDNSTNVSNSFYEAYMRRVISNKTCSHQTHTKRNNCTTLIKNGNLRDPCTYLHRKPLYIGGLFDLNGERGEALGTSELTAAQIAVSHINKRPVLPHYELVLLHNDTKCDPGVGMDALYNLIYRRPQVVMVIGSACSEVTKTLAEIVPYWNLLLVSYASTSPALSEREKYKTFFRLAPADSSQNLPRAMFINEFGWDTVATLYEIESDYSLAVDEMGTTFEHNNITIKISTSFRRYDDIKTNLIALKSHDARIIIGGYSEKAAREVLCQAYHLHMYGPRYVWIIIGDYVEGWWQISNDTTCSSEQLHEAADGYFTVHSLNSLSQDDKSSFNISVRHFLDDYEERKGAKPISPYATSTYDTVWTVALTLRKTIDQSSEYQSDNVKPLIEQFTYENGTKIRELFLSTFQDLGFLGLSGPISFEGPDRKAISVISQNQHGRIVRVALYEPEEKKLNFFCKSCQSIVWLEGRAPRDKTIMVCRQKKIDVSAFLCVSGISLTGLILAALFLAFNLYQRRLRYIKLSSPKLNNVAVIGCMLVYAGIIVLGYDGTMLEEVYYFYLCTGRAFLFAAGFSLSFGAMFTKTYRVHQIFTRANRGLLKSKLLRDQQLLFIVGALLIVDSIVLLIWGFVDPMHKQITNLTMEIALNDDDLIYIYQLTKCHSHHLDKWTGILYVYKGLMLVFGVYMAWETRHVKIPALNDARYIGMNVYNVVIMSVLIVTISNILSHQPTLAYVIESSFMLLSTTTTLCLLFIPKIYAIVTYKGELVVAASGITVEANCRRFAVDERREHFYRAEVQNRVYKREIIELDEEINRLKRLVDLPVKPYPKLPGDILFKLPESPVDATPNRTRRSTLENDLYCSISDAGDVCMGLSEDRSNGAQVHTEDLQARPKTLRQRANRLSIRVATNYAYNKLCKLRPRFSVGSVNFKNDYEDLKTSPVSPNTLLPFDSFICRSESPHSMIGYKERSSNVVTPVWQQNFDKNGTRPSDPHTFGETDSENTRQGSFNTLQVPVTQMNYLSVPSTVGITGCEDNSSNRAYSAPVRRRRKQGCTVNAPFIQEPRLHSDSTTTKAMVTPAQHQRSESVLENEHRRVKGSCSESRQQAELQNMKECESTVSVV